MEKQPADLSDPARLIRSRMQTVAISGKAREQSILCADARDLSVTANPLSIDILINN